jgi:sulfoxide reductase heme-binding subunit YedZ
MSSSPKWLVKYALRLAIWIWFSYWIAQIFVGDLGAAPALELNHHLGNMALVLLTANLLLGIGLDLLKSPAWLRFWISERRFVGVSRFLILLAHIFFYFLNEGFEGKAVTQIYTKTYLIFASLSFLILLALALTSNSFSLRRLGGKNWKRLHRTVYAAQVLLFGHILLIEKADLMLYGPWLILLFAFQTLRWTVKFRRKVRAN